MDGKDVVNALHQYIAIEKNNGASEISIEALEERIHLAEKYAVECYDYRKMEHETNLEMFKTVISSGANALKAAMIINGGGALALLTFSGKIKDSGIQADMNFLSYALFFFCLGVFLAAISSGTTYLTQSRYHLYGKSKIAYLLNLTSICIVAASYALFFVGVYWAGGALGLEIGKLWEVFAKF